MSDEHNVTDSPGDQLLNSQLLYQLSYSGRQGGNVTAGASDGKAARRCPACQLALPVTAFGTRTVGGRTYTQSYCRACHAARVTAWRKRPGKAARHAAHVAAYRARHPEKVRARSQVQQARAAGRLTPTACGACGAVGVSLHGHHADYRVPLGVVWLCRPCHGVAHRRGGAA